MSIHVPRHFYSLAAATLVLSAGITRTAVAKECTTDSDCSAGYQCDLAPTKGGTSGVGGSTGSSRSDAATPTPGDPTSARTDGGVATTAPAADGGLASPSTGTCEPKPIVCASTADCPADFECVKDWIAVTNPSCPADTKCSTPPPQPSDTGTCHAVPRPCSTAADCPAPLVCQSQSSTCSGGASVDSNGVVTTLPETCTQGPSVCTYVPTTCTADSACADSYQCVTVSEGQQCSASGGGCARSDGSVSCADVAPPVCTSFVVKNCMPKQIPCAAGQACPSGWSCFDYATFSGNIPGWIADDTGRACLPDGLVLAVEGHAAGEGGSSSGSDSAGSSGGDKGGTSITLRTDAGLTGGASLDAGTAVPSTDPVASGADAGGTQPVTGVTAAKAQGGGCTLAGGRPAGANLWLALALAGLVVRVARRRPSGRQ